MPISGFNSNRGIGTGQAQIYNSSGSVALYGKILAQQKAEREAEQRALANQLSKIKIDGLREADKPEYFKKYAELQETASKAYSAKDKQTKFNLQSELDKGFHELNNFVDQSKKYGALHTDVSSKFLDDRFRNQFTDDAVAQWQQSDKLSINDPKIIKDPSTLARQIDTSKILDEFAKIDDQVMQAASRYDNDMGTRTKSGNREGTVYQNIRRGDPKVQALNYLAKYDTDRTTRAFIQKEYADLFDKYPEQEAKAMAIQDFISKRPLVREEAPRYVWDTPEDNFYKHWDYQLSHPKAPNVIMAGQPVSVSFPIGEDDKGIIKTDNFYPVNVANANFAGTKTYDLKKGKLGENLPASADYGVVGVTTFPVTTLAFGNVPKGALAQPKFAKEGRAKGYVEDKAFTVVQQTRNGRQITHLVPFELTPNNVVNTKAFQGAIAGFKVPTGGVKPIAPKTTSKQSDMVTVVIDGKTGQIPRANLEAFKKKYPKAQVK